MRSKYESNKISDILLQLEFINQCIELIYAWWNLQHLVN